MIGRKYLPALIAVAVLAFIIVDWPPGGPLAWEDRDLPAALTCGLIAALSAASAFALHRWAGKLGDVVLAALWFVAVCLAAGFGGASFRLFLGLE